MSKSSPVKVELLRNPEMVLPVAEGVDLVITSPMIARAVLITKK